MTAQGRATISEASMHPDLSDVPMKELSTEDLNNRLTPMCDVCGKPRVGGPGGRSRVSHAKCAKIRQKYYARMKNEPPLDW